MCSVTKVAWAFLLVTNTYKHFRDRVCNKEG